MKVFLKIIGIILLVVVVLAAVVGITGLVVLNSATAGEITESYEVDEETNIAALLLATMADQDIVLNEGNVNYLIKSYVGDDLSESFKLNQLFVKLNGDKGTIYAELELTTGTKLIDKVYPITADFSIDFADSFATVTIENIKSGKFEVSGFVLGCVEKFVELPPIVAIDGETVNITYDCTQLDGVVEGLLISMLSDEETVASLGSMGNILAAIPEENLTKVVNVIINNITIEDSTIVIDAQLIDLAALVEAVGPTILALIAG